MSRIGKKPVEIPKGVKVAIADGVVSVEGPLGKLSMTHRPEIGVAVDDEGKHVVATIGDAGAGNVGAYWGLTRALIQNMVEGVTKGFEKTLEVSGVGYTAAVEGQRLKLNVGFAHPVMVNIPMGVDVQVDRQQVKVKGIDKQAVGQFAADVRARRKPEPYNGKGIKYADEQVRRKQGKQFGS
jgi:large subunit ribosomal protein L6